MTFDIKKLAMGVLLALSAISCGTSAATFRVGTFNLWRSDLAKRYNLPDYLWETRKDKLAQAISNCDFDFFAAEEVDTTMAKELFPIVKGYSWFTFSPYDSLGRGAVKAQALVFKTDRFEVEENHHFWYSDTPQRMSSGWDEMKFKRGGCCFILKEKATGRRIFVMVSHMPLGKEANFHAAQIILDKAKEYNLENLPAFFMGDLNTRVERNSSELLRTYWTDSYLTDVPKLGTEGTFNNHDVSTPIPAERRIDYIYFRGEGITPVRYVCHNDLYGGTYASDHCPVYVDFKVK